ncbi:ribose-phosphate diphosphokinase [Lacimicrobium alkaliphilum]|uniref:Phosphoribosylpyrophosphate synthetase n=1 Tax=Lacimicrobium alkaliphilum TaxID=1526571 RepID=A0ABQ1RC94_9ALTE|nr:ribose-phosphate diphosphokinase [Lacimicrobium alkaliphilum]GGD64895.1 phosphoribosylpyrophosphate synthetase [Lacimicrobium alkaliphilum]
MTSAPIVFSLSSHPLAESLPEVLNAETGKLNTRLFPDGESYLRIDTQVSQRDCIVLIDLCQPNDKYLPLIFLTETLRELGCRSVGIVVPYLSYMRQDIRFQQGEAVTSRVFAGALSTHIDWLVTVDPHLHRYHSLGQIYTVPSVVVQGAPALADWLKPKSSLLLVGPDEESEQWVKAIARDSGHAYVIGTKQRFGDRDVTISLPDLQQHRHKTAVIIDDVISSGQTIVQTVKALQQQGFSKIDAAAVHGIFANQSDQLLKQTGIGQLVTCNTIPHSSNNVDITSLLIPAIQVCLQKMTG